MKPVRMRGYWLCELCGCDEEGNLQVMFSFLQKALHEQMAASVHEISNLIEPVAIAARSEASQLGHKVEYQGSL